MLFQPANEASAGRHEGPTVEKREEIIKGAEALIVVTEWTHNYTVGIARGAGGTLPTFLSCKGDGGRISNPQASLNVSLQ